MVFVLYIHLELVTLETGKHPLTTTFYQHIYLALHTAKTATTVDCKGNGCTLGAICTRTFRSKIYGQHNRTMRLHKLTSDVMFARGVVRLSVP